MLRSSLFLLPVVALFLTSAVGCGGSGSSAEKKLIGKWELSTEHIREAMKEEMAKNSEDGEGPEAAFGASMMEEMLAQMKMSMDFQNEGKVVISASMMGQEKIDEGTWEVVSVSGNEVTLRIKTSDSDDEPGKLTFLDDDTIELLPPEGQQDTSPAGQRKIVLKRVK